MRTASITGARPSPRALPLWTLVLLCVSLLFIASTAQACHTHGTLVSANDGKLWASAPVDECPLCAATHAALPAEQPTTAAPAPQLERLVLGQIARPHVERWSYDLFSRPPPSDLPLT